MRVSVESQVNSVYDINDNGTIILDTNTKDEVVPSISNDNPVVQDSRIQNLKKLIFYAKEELALTHDITSRIINNNLLRLSLGSKPQPQPYSKIAALKLSFNAKRHHLKLAATAF